MSTDRETKRFNPWPYSIIGFFAIAIVAAVVWVGFCIGHSTDLVAANYYEQEVQYQDQIDRMARTRDLPGAVNVTYDPITRLILIQLPEQHARQNPKGSVDLYRPSAAGLDRKLALAVDEVGRQIVDATELTSGLWHVNITWSVDGTEFYHAEKIVIEGHGT